MLAEANLVVLYFVIGQIEFLPNPIVRIEFGRAGQLTIKLDNQLTIKLDNQLAIKLDNQLTIKLDNQLAIEEDNQLASSK